MFNFIINFFLNYQWFGILLICCVWYVYRFYQNIVWKKLGVPYLTPLPVIGNEWDLIFGTKTQFDAQIVKYDRVKNEKFVGTYRMLQPVLFVKDLELIEKILIKDFHHFTDRGVSFDEKREPLTAHLFSLPGKRWKNLRNKLSPVFTSGKLKTMHHQLIDCADVLVDVFQTYAKTNEKIDFKETMAKFTTDVIGSCAYGLNINSLKDPNNKFREMGKKVFQQSTFRKIKAILFFIIVTIWPKLAFSIGLRSFPNDVNEFFLTLVPQTIKAREKNPQYNRNDFIQLLMNLRKQDQNDSNETEQDQESDQVYLDDNTMAANSFLFFVAGFETTASTLTYCLFELAQHPDIQDKLYNEIKEVLAKHDQQPTYDAIKQLTYMDMVISETLRKYPPVIINFRICTESYRIPDTDIIIPKGQRIEIPTYALHHDPKIFPDPETFQPERFSPENKDSIPKGAYIPFGDGPRICLGARFAQMEIKVCLSKILSKFKIIKNPDMPNEIKFAATPSIILVPKGGIFMNIEPRN